MNGPKFSLNPRMLDKSHHPNVCESNRLLKGNIQFTQSSRVGDPFADCLSLHSQTEWVIHLLTIKVYTVKQSG